MNRFQQAALACILSSVVAFAADHDNIETGLPLKLEDPAPVGYRGREVQVSVRGRDFEGDRYDIELIPRFEIGFPKNAQIRVAGRFVQKNDDDLDAEDVEVGLLYNFNTEGILLPSLALEAAALFAVNEDNEGVDAEVKALAAKTFGYANADRFHINVAYQYNDEAAKDQRRDMGLVLAGYSRRCGPDALLVLDFFREWEREKEVESNIAEAGFRIQLDPLTVLSFAGGFGFRDESPRFLVSLGIQRSI